MSRRLAAAVTLVVGAATIVLAIVVTVSEFPRGLILLGCVLVAGAPAGTARSVAASRGRRASPSPRSPWPAPS